MEKEILLPKRSEFFKRIIAMLVRDPDKTDKVLNQDVFYVKPDLNSSILNSEKGELVINIPAIFYGKSFNVCYSIWQFSDSMKIGVFIDNKELGDAFQKDTHREIKYLWGNLVEPRNDGSRGVVGFYEWEFHTPDLYTKGYLAQEKFILGVRHMHFRLMRILSDACLSLSQVKKVNPLLKVEN